MAFRGRKDISWDAAIYGLSVLLAHCLSDYKRIKTTMKPELLSTKCPRDGKNHFFEVGVCRCGMTKLEHIRLVKNARKVNDSIRSKERGAR